MFQSEETGQWGLVWEAQAPAHRTAHGALTLPSADTEGEGSEERGLQLRVSPRSPYTCW